MPILFDGVGAGEQRVTADARLENVATFLKGNGFERTGRDEFTLTVGPGQQRSLFGGVTLSSGAEGPGGAVISIALTRHTPLTRPWRRDSQTEALVSVRLDSGQREVRFMEMKALDFAASALARRLAAGLAGAAPQIRGADTPTVAG